MEAFTDTVGLGRTYLGLGMRNVIDCQIQLVIMLLGFAAISSSPIRQYPHLMVAHGFQAEGVPWPVTVMGILMVYSLAQVALESVSTKNTKRADAKGVLRAQIAGMDSFYLTGNFVILLLAPSAVI